MLDDKTKLEIVKGTITRKINSFETFAELKTFLATITKAKIKTAVIEFLTLDSQVKDTFISEMQTHKTDIETLKTEIESTF